MSRRACTGTITADGSWTAAERARIHLFGVSGLRAHRLLKRCAQEQGRLLDVELEWFAAAQQSFLLFWAIVERPLLGRTSRTFFPANSRGLAGFC